MSNWVIGQKHKHYGEVVMMRTIEGELKTMITEKYLNKGGVNKLW